jgi:hypothetical protein
MASGNSAWKVAVGALVVAALVTVLILLASGGKKTSSVTISDGRASRTVTIFNMVTSGPTALREDTKPLRLFTSPAICYQPTKCATSSPQYRAGDKVKGVICQTSGARVTNGDDENKIDDHNPGLATSTLWYGVRTDKGIRYFSVVWAVPSERRGLGLPKCPHAA